MNPPQTVAVVTSRLWRLIALDEPWVAGLRGVLRRIASSNDRLIVGDKTAGADFVKHAAARLGVPVVTVAPSSDDVHDDSDLPVRDQAVIFQAETIYVLHLRLNGNLHRLLRKRLEQRQATVILVDIPALQSESARRELCTLGAQLWVPTAPECAPFDHRSSDQNSSEPVTQQEGDVYLIVPFPSEDGWSFLTHSTRACPGPWPNESYETYADSLLESSPDADHSPLGVLRRIVRQRSLVASNQTIRGGHHVVSFTACPLMQLYSLHQFRPHRVRWDFEPYGLCIRREWLIARGAQPVRYSHESDWESMTESDRPFFQLATGESGIDWSAEREWRHLGNLDLSELTADDVILFVPDFESAKSLAKVTDWPITLWPGFEP